MTPAEFKREYDAVISTLRALGSVFSALWVTISFHPIRVNLRRFVAKTLCAFCVVLLASYVSTFAVQQAWVAKYSHGSNSQAVAIALDKAGNIYVAGHSTRTNAPFDFDYVVIKYNPAGVQQWVNRYGGAGTNDQVRSMVANTNGEVFVTGTSDTVKYLPNGSLAWSAPYGGQDIAADEEGTAYVTGFSTTDFATVKIDSTGSNVWLRTWDHTGRDDRSRVVTVDRFGNVFIAGLATWFCDRLGCYQEPYLIKYNSNGDGLWTNVIRRGQHLFFTQFAGFACDDAGDLYLAIHSWGIGLCCSWDAFKISTSGERIWAKSLLPALGGGVKAMALDVNADLYYTGHPPFSDLPYAYKVTSQGTDVWQAISQHLGNSIAVDLAGNAYVTGQWPGVGSGNDFTTIKYGTNGQELWVKRFTEAGNSDDQSHAIAVSPVGEVYVTGFSNPSPGVYEITTIKYVELNPIEKTSNGNMFLTFCGAPGSNYIIQASATLTNWTNIASVTANTNGLYTFEDTNAPLHSQRFYRALLE